MLRVCTWNINLGLRLDDILEAISKHRDFAGLDLLALQEASVHGGRQDGDAIASVLGRGYECHQVAAQTVRGHVQANALIWNRPHVKVERAGHLQLPRARGGALLAQQRGEARGDPARYGGSGSVKSECSSWPTFGESSGAPTTTTRPRTRSTSTADW